jgi:hypothetical protein
MKNKINTLKLFQTRRLASLPFIMNEVDMFHANVALIVGILIFLTILYFFLLLLLLRQNSRRRKEKQLLFLHAYLYRS